MTRCAPDQSVNTGAIYLTEDGERVYFLPPRARWKLPQNFFAAEELENTPDAVDAIASFLAASVELPALRGRAKGAAPGFFTRIIARGVTEQARAAAARLHVLFSDARLQTLANDTWRVL